MMIRRDVWREYSRGSLWLLPVVAVVVSVGLGAVLSRINVSPDSLLAFQGTADDARNLLIGISSTMVTVIALLLGLAVVALQLSSTQFSPRLLRNFLRDRPNQVVLSVFVGRSPTARPGCSTVGVSGGERATEFPRFAVTVAVGLLFLSLGLLVFFADHLAHSIQVDQVMRVVERNTLAVIRKLPTGGERTRDAAAGRAPSWRRDRPDTCRSSTSPRCWRPPRRGVCTPAATQGRRARRRGHPAGLGLADRPTDPRRRRRRPSRRLCTAAVRIGFERTLEQDPGLGHAAARRRGVQGAVPGGQRPLHRDPGHRTPLRVCTARSPPRPLRRPSPARARLVVIPPARVRRAPGARCRADPALRGQPSRRSSQALLRLLTTALEARGHAREHRAAITEQADLLVSAAQRETAEPADLALVHSERAALDHALETHEAARRD